MIKNEFTNRVHLSKEEKAAFNNFYVVSKEMEEFISSEFVRRMAGKELKALVKEGTVTLDTVPYAISWLSFPELCYNCNSVIMKFRFPIKGTTLFPTVLIVATRN